MTYGNTARNATPFGNPRINSGSPVLPPGIGNSGAGVPPGSIGNPGINNNQNNQQGGGLGFFDIIKDIFSGIGSAINTGNAPSINLSGAGSVPSDGYGAITPGGREGGINAPGRTKVGGILGGDIGDAVLGGIMGLHEGIMFGSFFGGKFGTSGGLIAGGIAQAVGVLTFPIISAISFTINGVMMGSKYMSDYSYALRATQGMSGGLPENNRNPGPLGGNSNSNNSGGGNIYPPGIIPPGSKPYSTFQMEDFNSISEDQVLLLSADGDEVSISISSDQQLVSSDQQLLQLQSAMSSLTDGTSALDGLSTDLGMQNETLLLAANN